MNFNIFLGFQKNNYFLGMMILWIFFLGHHKIGLYLGSFLNILGSFLKVKVQIWGYFLGVAKISNIFGVLEIPDIYIWVKSRC